MRHAESKTTNENTHHLPKYVVQRENRRDMGVTAAAATPRARTRGSGRSRANRCIFSCVEPRGDTRVPDPDVDVVRTRIAVLGTAPRMPGRGPTRCRFDRWKSPMSQLRNRQSDDRVGRCSPTSIDSGRLPPGQRAERVDDRGVATPEFLCSRSLLTPGKTPAERVFPGDLADRFVPDRTVTTTQFGPRFERKTQPQEIEEFHGIT